MFGFKRRKELEEQNRELQKRVDHLERTLINHAFELDPSDPDVSKIGENIRNLKRDNQRLRDLFDIADRYLFGGSACNAHNQL